MTRSHPVVLGLVILAICACSQDGPTLAYLNEDAVILAFGNSLTRGTGAHAGESYPAVLEALIGRKVVNAGVPGELSAAGLARIEGVLDAVEPQLLILCHGGNDMLRKRDLGLARSNIEKMVAAARQRGIPALLLGVPRPGIWLSTADFYIEVAEAIGAPIEADAIADILGDNGLKADAVHPNAAGYRQLAEKIRERLVDLGAL